MKHKLIPAVYIIIEDDDKLLFLRRSNTGYQDGKLSLPAGHIEKGETPYEAAIREAHEEIGITVYNEEIEIQHVCYRYEVDRIDYYLKINKWNGDIKNNEPHKCSELVWLQEPTDEVIGVVKGCIRNIDQNILFSESVN